MEEEWFNGGTDPPSHPLMDLHRRMLGVDPPGPLVLRVVRLHPVAVLPARQLDGDAGWDLAAAEDTVIPPGETCKVPTGLAVALPAGSYAQVRGRSSLASNGLFVVGGVMDPGYRGEWIVLLYNSSSSVAIGIDAGDRIAQFTLHRIELARLEEVAELPPSARGAGGFGSTGR
jgi:dUTP pyrophosphatase